MKIYLPELDSVLTSREELRRSSIALYNALRNGIAVVLSPNQISDGTIILYMAHSDQYYSSLLWMIRNGLIRYSEFEYPGEEGEGIQTPIKYVLDKLEKNKNFIFSLFETQFKIKPELKEKWVAYKPLLIRALKYNDLEALTSPEIRLEDRHFCKILYRYAQFVHELSLTKQGRSRRKYSHEDNRRNAVTLYHTVNRVRKLCSDVEDIADALSLLDRIDKRLINDFTILNNCLDDPSTPFPYVDDTFRLSHWINQINKLYFSDEDTKLLLILLIKFFAYNLMIIVSVNAITEDKYFSCGNILPDLANRQKITKLIHFLFNRVKKAASSNSQIESFSDYLKELFLSMWNRDNNNFKNCINKMSSDTNGEFKKLCETFSDKANKSSIRIRMSWSILIRKLICIKIAFLDKRSANHKDILQQIRYLNGKAQFIINFYAYEFNKLGSGTNNKSFRIKIDQYPNSPLDTRSEWYKLIEGLNASDSVKDYAKIIIDFAYNCTVEDSISGIIKNYDYNDDANFKNYFMKTLSRYKRNDATVKRSSGVCCCITKSIWTFFKYIWYILLYFMWIKYDDRYSPLTLSLMPSQRKSVGNLFDYTQPTPDIDKELPNWKHLTYTYSKVKDFKESRTKYRITKGIFSYARSYWFLGFILPASFAIFFIMLYNATPLIGFLYALLLNFLFPLIVICLIKPIGYIASLIKRLCSDKKTVSKIKPNPIFLNRIKNNPFLWFSSPTFILTLPIFISIYCIIYNLSGSICANVFAVAIITIVSGIILDKLDSSKTYSSLYRLHSQRFMTDAMFSLYLSFITWFMVAFLLCIINVTIQGSVDDNTLKNLASKYHSFKDSCIHFLNIKYYQMVMGLFFESFRNIARPLYTTSVIVTITVILRKLFDLTMEVIFTNHNSETSYLRLDNKFYFISIINVFFYSYITYPIFYFKNRTR